ncbi:hypothetical protein F2Q68_00010963, partial [Brassica cretica]
LNDLAAASRSISTLEEMIDKDIEAGCVKKYGSHTRNLLKVKQGLEMIKVLCEELLATEGDDSLKDAAIKAYNQVLFPHHQYNIQKACATGLNSLPSKSLVLLLLGEAVGHPTSPVYPEDFLRSVRAVALLRIYRWSDITRLPNLAVKC